MSNLTEQIAIPRWAIEIGRLAIPLLGALLVAYIKLQTVVVEIEAIKEKQSELCSRLATVESAGVGQRRDLDVLTAQIITRLDNIEKQLSELKAQRGQN